MSPGTIVKRQMSTKKIFIINLILGIFLCLAHIPVVILKLSGASDFESVNLLQVLPLVPVDLVLLLGSIAALAGSDDRKNKILPIHAAALLLLAVLTVGMLLWFTLIGLPKGNFSWTPGMGAALVGYSVHVAKRAFYSGSNKIMKNAGWYSASVVFLFELALMYKFYVVHFT